MWKRAPRTGCRTATMTILTASLDFLRWLGAVTRRLVAIDRTITLKVLLSIISTQVITVLITFVPLKVILLAGSDGVPRYFAMFVSEDTRSLWIAGLAVSIVALYGVSLLLDSATQRWSARGADTMLGLAERVPITDDETGVAESSYHRLCEAVATLIFAGVATLVGLALYPPLFLLILALIATEFLLTSRVAGDLRAAPTARGSRFIRERTGDLLTLLKTANFLVVVAFLLSSFLLTDGINLLIAIVVLMISRQVFNALVSLAKNAQKLTRRRGQIDTLLFTDVQLTDERSTHEHEMRSRYALPTRLERLEHLAAGHRAEASNLSEEDARRLATIDRSVWVDSGDRQVTTFDLFAIDSDGTSNCLFREQVYDRKRSRGLERQEHLLRHIDSDWLPGPRQVCRYTEGPFVGRLLDVRGLTAPKRKEFRQGRDQLLERLTALEVPASLERAHTNTHPALWDRVGRTVLDRMELVTDEAWTTDAHQELTEQLAPLSARLAKLPTVLVNHRCNERNALMDPNGDLKLVEWRSWSLEPAGAGFDPQTDSSQLLLRLAAAVRHRRDATITLRLADMLTTAVLLRMEQLVIEGRPKQALRLAHDLLPLLGLPDADVVAALDDGSQDVGQVLSDTQAEGESLANPGWEEQEPQDERDEP